MRRSAACVLFASAFAVIGASCGVPDFQYTSGSSSSEMVMREALPCAGTDMLCEAPGICCLFTDAQCLAPDAGACQGAPVSCRYNDDCPSSAPICCVETGFDQFGNPVVSGIGCELECDQGMRMPTCKDSSTCTDGSTCTPVLQVTDAYTACQPP